jgi:hypothetical protein
MMRAVLFVLVLTPFLSNAQSIGDACSTDADCSNVSFVCTDGSCACSIDYMLPSLDRTTCLSTVGNSCNADGSLLCTEESSCVDLNADGSFECNCNDGFIPTAGPTCDNSDSAETSNLICCPPTRK